jgi:hypothetical protein
LLLFEKWEMAGIVEADDFLLRSVDGAGTVLKDPIPGTVTIVGPTAPFARAGR